MTDEQINPGDTVDVLDNEGSLLYKGIVLGLPCATGDCWKIETAGEIAYVQMFGYIVKKKVATKEMAKPQLFIHPCPDCCCGAKDNKITPLKQYDPPLTTIAQVREIYFMAALKRYVLVKGKLEEYLGIASIHAGYDPLVMADDATREIIARDEQLRRFAHDNKIMRHEIERLEGMLARNEGRVKEIVDEHLLAEKDRLEARVRELEIALERNDAS